MGTLRLPALAVVCGLALHPQASIEVGQGAPSEAIRQRFVSAYFRNGFSNLVSSPPLSEVRRFGTTGLIQEFQDAAGAQRKLALVKANTSTAGDGANDVFQVKALMYAHYNGVGVGTAGYPTNDTAACGLVSGANCFYQLFDKSHVLVVYDKAVAGGDSFTIRDPFYTRWTSLGGLSGLGPAVTAESSVASSLSSIAATTQVFAGGAIFNITSGVLEGRLITVQRPVWDLYSQNNAQAGFLGLPSGEEVTLANGRKRQSFEGGAIEYAAGSSPSIRLPVFSVSLGLPANSLRMNLNETRSIEATVFSVTGAELTDRSVIWSTSNGRIVAIQADGPRAVLRAVGGGSAIVTATSEGKSTTVSVLVVAPCCSVGEGAPAETQAAAFRDAVARNRLSVRLPAAQPVRRVGGGLMQEFTAADGSGERYIVALSDQSPLAFAITGAILSRFEQLRGFPGILGYPSSDPTPGGRQMFVNQAALAGSPVRLVDGGILARWAALGYETGAAGSPVGDPVSFFTFAGTTGRMQAFRGGVLVEGLAGSQAGRVYFSSGLILGRYLSLGGPNGQLGMPLGEEFTLAGRRKQDFEGGEIAYTPGESEARVTESERRPAVSATPATVIAGSRLRLTVGGFDTAATLRVSISGRPDFLVNTENGAYSWELYVPSTAAPGAVSIRASHVGGSAVAQGGYVVRSPEEARLTVATNLGDGQTGAPGAVLPLGLRIQVTGESGNPMVGAPVLFEASPGAQIGRSAVTDERGEAEAVLRLPPTEGVALATASALGRVVTFSARVAPSVIKDFPTLMQNADGPLVAALANVLRHYQNRAEIPAPNGLADPALLAAYLKSFCVADSKGGEICDGFLDSPVALQRVPNPWRAPGFAGGNVDIVAVKPLIETIRDLLTQGVPVLLGLALTTGEMPAGMNFVVATGVAGNGGIVIHDPNPAFGRISLNSYLDGFSEGGRAYRGAVAGALAIYARSPQSTGFLAAVSPGASVSLSSPVGVCGEIFDAAATRFLYCDGTQPAYQLDFWDANSWNGAVTDLSNPGTRYPLSGRGEGTFQLIRPATLWTVEPQNVSIRTSGVLNAASLKEELAPGTLAVIQGTGLAQGGQQSSVEISGIVANVPAASPFQLTVQVPLELAPGAHSLLLRSPFGVAETQIDVREAAPAVFVSESGRPSIANSDATLNSPFNPARRGDLVVVYGTGFGAINDAGLVHPAEASIRGIDIPVRSAGLTPGQIGVYEVSLSLPSEVPPGLSLPLVLRQGLTTAAPVEIAIE